jgi:hypothetical protein
LPKIKPRGKIKILCNYSRMLIFKFKKSGPKKWRRGAAVGFMFLDRPESPPGKGKPFDVDYQRLRIVPWRLKS